jgi:glutathione S-transferase
MLTLTAIESMADSLIGVRLLRAGAKVEAPYVDRQLYRVASCLDWLEQRVTPEGFWPGTFSVLDMNLMFPLLYGEKRGVIDYRGGRWPRIAAMIDHWQTRPSVLATPVNDLPR